MEHFIKLHYTVRSEWYLVRSLRLPSYLLLLLLEAAAVRMRPAKAATSRSIALLLFAGARLAAQGDGEWRS
jgi:hypothetical protein